MISDTEYGDRPQTPSSESTAQVEQENDLIVDGDLNGEAPKGNISCSPNLVPSSTPTKAPTVDIEHIHLDWTTEIAERPVFLDGTNTDYPPCPDLRKHDNPFTWPKARKNAMTWVSCATSITAALAAGSYASPEAQLIAKWHISQIAFEVGITVFTVGFAIAPMFIAPFSEINGRRPVFITTGIIFVVSQLGSALTDSYWGMLLARFFVGVGGSTFSTMVGGILADIWVTSERNTPMVLYAGASLFGTGLGPLYSGFVAQRLLWRWVFYIQAIVAGILVGLVTVFFKETRGPILLSRRAKMLNKWYEELESCGCIGMELSCTDDSSMEKATKVRRIRYKVLAEEQRVSVWKMIAVSLHRPAHLLLTEPIVITFSAWVSIAWVVLYLQFGAIPLIYERNHGFTLEQTGSVFTAVCVGTIISTFLSIYQDKWAVYRFGRKFTDTPEGRLWFTCGESLLMPIGMFWFGWTCYSSIHWIVPTIGLVLVTMGIFSIFLATLNYMADSYQTYASSALAACGVSRNLLAGGFSLITVPMFNGLGFQGASSLLGGVAFLICLGPILLIFYGPKIRSRSKIARQFVEGDS